jgi:hypothetical protein
MRESSQTLRRAPRRFCKEARGLGSGAAVARASPRDKPLCSDGQHAGSVRLRWAELLFAYSTYWGFKQPSPAWACSTVCGRFPSVGRAEQAARRTVVIDARMLQHLLLVKWTLDHWD